jgi:hypothetical protein
MQAGSGIQKLIGYIYIYIDTHAHAESKVTKNTYSEHSNGEYFSVNASTNINTYFTHRRVGGLISLWLYKENNKLRD